MERRKNHYKQATRTKQNEEHYDSKTPASIEIVTRNIAYFDTVMRNRFSAMMTLKRFELIWLAGIKCLMPVVESKRNGAVLCSTVIAQSMINWIKTDMKTAKKVTIKAKAKTKPKAKKEAAPQKTTKGKKRRADALEDPPPAAEEAPKSISGWVPLPSASSIQAGQIYSMPDTKETEWLDTLNNAYNSAEMPLRLRGTTLEVELPEVISLTAVASFVFLLLEQECHIRRQGA